jgi:ABC-type Zn2+ transport system substrate-binding protein/surface adhesin
MSKKKVMTLRDFGGGDDDDHDHDHDHGHDDDDDKPQSYYAGGSRNSGQLILDPTKASKKLFPKNQSHFF